MSKKDKIQSEIDYIKALIIFVLTAMIAVIGWVIGTRKTAEFGDFVLGICAIIALSVVATS
nr:hypothetical protein [uncultured Campylobacter sp.]